MTLPAANSQSMTLPQGFRPEAVPVQQIDSHLPAVPSEQQSIAALRARFARPTVWTPEWVTERPGLSQAPAIQAAVLIPVVKRPRPGILLTQRSALLAKHSGQIAFPGGRVDAEDASAVAAALREAREEVGLDARHVEVLGELPSYTTGSGYEVQPVVALVDADVPLHANADEVADIFEVPLAHVLDPANHRHHQYQYEGLSRQWLSMPYHDPQVQRDRFIWGVTASILRNFYRFMQAP